MIVAVCREYGLKERDIAAPGQERRPSEARAAVGWLAMASGSTTLTAVGRQFGRDVGSISSAVRRLTQRAANDRRLAARLDRMRSAVRVVAEG